MAPLHACHQTNKKICFLFSHPPEKQKLNLLPKHTIYQQHIFFARVTVVITFIYNIVLSS